MSHPSANATPIRIFLIILLNHPHTYIARTTWPIPAFPFDLILASSKDSHSYALTDHEEQALHQYIQRLDGLGMSCRRPISALPPQKRHPQYKIRKQKPLASQRKNTHKLEDILRVNTKESRAHNALRNKKIK